MSHPSTLITTEEQYFLRHLTLCIGVQKGGTGSIRNLVNETGSHILTGGELHYFDRQVFKIKNVKYESFATILNYIYSHDLSVSSYMKELSSLFQIDAKNTSITSKYLIFEKPPKYVLYPHAAYVIANDFVPFGTKLFLFLRNPVKRLISGYFRIKKADKIQKRVRIHVDRGETVQNFIQMVTANQEIVSFQNTLHRIYDGMGIEDEDEPPVPSTSILLEVLDGYHQILHSLSNARQSQRLLSWLRSCYAPQVLVWSYYIQHLNPSSKYKHSLKIIQSERYYDEQTYHETVKHILCFMHYDVDSDDYNDWMADCVDNDRYKAAEKEAIRSNSVTPSGLSVDQETVDLISDSFSICNKWLKVVVEMQSEYVLRNGFNWTYIDHMT